MYFPINQEFEKNEKGRDFVVGDLHGCYDDLMEKLKEVNFNPKEDRVFSVGDLVDRGKQNEECLSLLLEDWFFSVLGNHELMMMRSLTIGSIMVQREWLQCHGSWFYDLPEEKRMQIEKTYLPILEKLPISMTIETEANGWVGIVHADVPNDDWNYFEDMPESIDVHGCVWNRSRVKQNHKAVVKNIDLVIFGHTALTHGCLSFGNTLCIDTGCCIKYHVSDYLKDEENAEYDLTLIDLSEKIDLQKYRPEKAIERVRKSTNI